MSRKDYVAIAFVIRPWITEAMGRQEHTTVRVLRAVAEALTILFRNDNPAFDRARFLRACGLE